MSDSEKPSGTFGSYAGTNSDTFTDDARYEVCQRSGLKVAPGQLVREWTGLWVLPRFLDHRHPQELQRPSTEGGVSVPNYEEKETPEFIQGVTYLLATEDDSLISQEDGFFIETEASQPITEDSL